MKNLNDLLGQTEPEVKPTEEPTILNTIHVTRHAYQKAYAYAHLACKIARRSIECGGYLIAPKDSGDRIATDAYLARDQKVAAGLFTVEAEDVIKAGREVDQLGYRVLGWWHSHGKLNTFFSQLDDRGQMTVLNEICAFNYITKPSTKPVHNLETEIEDGKIILFDKQNPNTRYEITGTGNIDIASLQITEEKKIGFAYGLVVNAGLDKTPYAEMATREYCYSCRDSVSQSDPCNISVFGPPTEKMDLKQLRKDIRERVKWQKKFLSYFKKKTRIGTQPYVPGSFPEDPVATFPSNPYVPPARPTKPVTPTPLVPAPRPPQQTDMVFPTMPKPENKKPKRTRTKKKPKK